MKMGERLFTELELRPRQRITSQFFTRLVDVLNQLYGNIKTVEERGTAVNPWDYFYAYYGFFQGDLFVKGKRVIKDGDPISIYDIQQPAVEKITQAIDQSLLTQYTKETRDVVVRLNIDVYGRLGVIISSPVDEYGNILTRPVDLEGELLPASGIIDTAVETSPKVIIEAPSNRAIDVRRAYLSSTSTGGEIYIRFERSGKIITALFPAKFTQAILPAIRIPGEVGENVIIEWTGVDTGAKIVYLMNYKLI